MTTFRSQSNQWALGIGLRRSTIYDTHRWVLWVNYGYTSASLCWKKNPPWPRNIPLHNEAGKA